MTRLRPQTMRGPQTVRGPQTTRGPQARASRGPRARTLQGPRATGARAGERGIALLSVVTVLVALILIAIPFAISMKANRDRMQSSLYRQRAVHETEQVSHAVVSWIRRTHPAHEARDGEKGDADWDSADEVTPPPSYRKTIEELWPRIDGQGQGDPDAVGVFKPSISDPRGSIWTWRVTDQNALVNVQGASHYLVGNLLGSAVLKEAIDPAATTIAVEDVTHVAAPGAVAFRKDGGFVRIGREVVRYASFDPIAGFRGCERGALQGGPSGENGGPSEHRKGAVLVDYAAWKIATHLVYANPGRLTGFLTLQDLRSIRSWGAGGVLEAERLEPILPYLTIWSARETAETFLAAQTIVNALPESPMGDGEILRLRDRQNGTGHTAYLNPGTPVRVTDGTTTHFDVVAVAGDEKAKEFGTAVTLAGRLPDGVALEGGRAAVAPLAPFPINVNTAPREVLAAVFSHLRLRAATELDHGVRPKKALEIATLLVEERSKPLAVEGEGGQDHTSGPFRSPRDFGRFLERLEAKQVIDFRQRHALLANAVNPHDDTLAFGTAPFCYRTLDVYAVETRAIVNDSAGEKAAEEALLRVVQVGADAATEWTLHTQSQFEIGLSLGSGGKYVTTYPNNVSFVSDRDAHVQPRRRAEQWVANAEHYPETLVVRDDGVRLEPARIRLPGATFRDHQDAAFHSDGWSTQLSQAYSVPVRGDKGLRTPDPKDPFVRPFTISFWWRPHEDVEWYAMDTGIEEFRNRIALFVRDGDQGRELVFRVCDGTLEGRAAEIYVPLEQMSFAPETWYHLQASARGCDATQMELFVDGVALGKRRGVSFLSGGISPDQTEIPIDRAEGFDEQGAIVVGTEVVEYESFTGESFTGCVRAPSGGFLRGTSPRSWPDGTTVRALGYSHPLLTELRRGGASLPASVNWEKFRVLKIEPDSPEIVTFTTEGGQSYNFRGIKSDTKSTTVRLLPYLGDADEEASTEAIEDIANTFSVTGFALLVAPVVQDGTEVITPAPPAESPPPGPPAGAFFPGPRRSDPRFRLTAAGDGQPPMGGADIVFYRRSGTSMTIERYQSTAWRSATEPHSVATALPSGATGPAAFGAFLVPISFLGTGGPGDYFAPAPGNEDDQHLQLYPTGGGSDYRSPRVLIGGENTSNAPDAVEVVVYNSLDTQKNSPSLCFLHDNPADLDAVFRLFPTYRIEPPATPGPGGEPGPGPGPAPGPGGGGGPPAPPPPSGGGGGGGPGGAVPPGLRPPSGGILVPLRVPLRPEVAPVGPGAVVLASAPADEPAPAPPRGPGGSVPPGLRDPFDPPTPPSGGGDPTTPPTAPPPTGGPPSESPGTPGDDGSSVILPSSIEVNGRLRFRGQNGTTDLRHPSGAASEDQRVLPCFRVLLRDPLRARMTGGHRPGRNDRITITQEGEVPEREAQVVRWSQHDGGTNWVALADFVTRDRYIPSDPADEARLDYRGLTRIAKFPSGELPDEHAETIEFGRSLVDDRPVSTAFLDELHVFRHDRFVSLGEVANPEHLTEETDTLWLRPVPPATTLVGVPGYREACGLVSLNGELIAYRGSHVEGDDVVVLEDLERGVLGTTARKHGAGPGCYARFVPNVPITYLEGDLPKDGVTVGTAKLHRDDWPREGLVRIVSEDAVELVHFVGRGDDALLVPEAIEGSDEQTGTGTRGLLRGRFGTDSLSHESGSIVVWQPFRVWDRYLQRRGANAETFQGVHDHPEGAYVELAKWVHGAFWRQARWIPNLDGRSDDIAPKATSDRRRAPQHRNVIVLARFDPSVPWDSKEIVDLRAGRRVAPTRDLRPERKIYVLDDPEGTNAFDFEADSAEFRIFFQFLPGCFEPMDTAEAMREPDERRLENAWKITPWLRSFTLEYSNPTRTLYSASVR